MAIQKRYILLASIILIPIVGFKSCQYSEKKHWMEYFPPPMKMEKMLVYETGCDGFFFCAGGVIVQMTEKDALQIRNGGLEYLNSLSDTAVNGRYIGKWRLVDPNEDNHLIYSGRGTNEHKSRLRLAVQTEDCYRTNGFRYICPESRLAYAGWMD